MFTVSSKIRLALESPTHVDSTFLDLHVWSLSESKIVASVHIMVKGPDLVNVSREIKRRFHRFGIHSS